MMTELPDLSERVSTFSALAGIKLRSQQSNCEMIQVFLQSNRFRQDLAQYQNQRTIKSPFPTSSTFTLNEYAQKALKEIYESGINYKKAGVILMGISQDDSQQLSIFEYENPKEKILMKVIDGLNLKLGEKIKFGNMDLRSKWKMRQEHLTPQYATNYNLQIPVILITPFRFKVST